MTRRSLRLLVVGPRLTEDLLLWKELARSLAASRDVPTMVLVGLGETGERYLEGEGIELPRVGQRVDPEKDLPIDVEMAMRMELRKAVSGLTDEGIAAVGFLGLDRGLIRKESGALQMRPGLVLGSATSGVVPVVGALARSVDALHGPEVRTSLPSLSSVASSLARTLAESKTYPEWGAMQVIWLVSGRLAEGITREEVSGRTGEPVGLSGEESAYLSVSVSSVSGVGRGKSFSV